MDWDSVYDLHSILFSCASNQSIQTKQADGFFDLGTRHLQQGDDDQAISAYNKALEINPRYVEAYLIGELLTGAKANWIRPSLIIARYFDRFKDARAYCNRGNAYIEKGQYDKASSITIKLLR